MEKKKVKNYRNYYLIAMVVATLLMSIGYARVESVTSNLVGNANAISVDAVFIYDATINSTSPADVFNSNISIMYSTMMQSRVVLNDNVNSTLTMNITIYNKSDDDVYFDRTVYGDNFYDNNNIDFTLNGLTHGQKLDKNDNVTFTMTFKYTDQYKASNPSTFTDTLNSYIGFEFKKGYSITYNGFSSVTGLDTVLLENESKNITFTSTHGIPYNVNVIGCTASYNSPTLSLSNPTANVIVSRLYSVAYSGFIGNTSSLINVIPYDGATITFTSTTGIPTAVSVTGATASYNSPTLVLTNVTGNVTIAGTFGQAGSGTVADPYIEPSNTYDPSIAENNAVTVYNNVEGEPQIVKDNNGNVTSFEYTSSSSTTPVVFENNDALSTGVIAMDGASFTIHIKFKADLSQNNGKFILSALQYNTSGDTFDGFTLYDYNSGYLRIGTYRARKRSNSTGLLNANNYSTYNSSAITGEHVFDVTIAYDPVGNKSQYGQIAFTASVDGGTSTTKYMRNTKAPGNNSNVVPETLTNAIVTIGGSGEGATDDVNHIEIYEFSVTRN